jgi:hypothetical protein
MAGWALGLSLLLCVPFAPLVGLGLGIAVLVRARDGRDHGAGMAIGATVIGSLYLLATIGLFAWGVVVGVQEELAGPERGEDGQVVDEGEIYIDELRVGDCVSRFERAENLDPDESPTGLVTVVHCDDLHLAEVFHIYDIEPDDYSDQEALDRASVEGCLPAYRTYVGKAFQRSRLELVYYNPTKDDLLFDGDQVICLVVGPALSTRMLEDSRR